MFHNPALVLKRGEFRFSVSNVLDKDSLKQQEGMPAHVQLLSSDCDVLGIVLCLGGWSWALVVSQERWPGTDLGLEQRRFKSLLPVFLSLFGNVISTSWQDLL